jgi:hypothetical protein
MVCPEFRPELLCLTRREKARILYRRVGSRKCRGLPGNKENRPKEQTAALNTREGESQKCLNKKHGPPGCPKPTIASQRIGMHSEPRTLKQYEF